MNDQKFLDNYKMYGILGRYEINCNIITKNQFKGLITLGSQCVLKNIFCLSTCHLGLSHVNVKTIERNIDQYLIYQ